MTIGFIGLGNMGTPIAHNLLAAGFTVQVYNRTPQKLKAFDGTPAKTFHDATQAVRDADVVVTMLSDDAAAEQVSAQIVPAMKQGAIQLAMSTIAPTTAKKLHDLHVAAGKQYVSCPVMGRPPAAKARQLFLLVSGSKEAKEKLQPLLDAMGQRTFDYGNDVTVSPTVKIMVNYQIFVITQMLSEVMLVAERANIDKQQFLDMMTNTVFGAPIVKVYGGLVVQEQDNPNGFAVKLASKDLRLMQEAAAGLQLQLPLADLVQQHFREMMATGHGDKDVAMLVAHLRETLKK